MANKRPQKLNVILHGAFAFVRGKQQLRVLIPKLEDHVYRAGSWLAETDLRGQAGPTRVEYELRGVKKTGKARFDLQKNVMLKNGASSKKAKHAPFATLIFPLPEKIASLRLAAVRRDAFIDPRSKLAVKGEDAYVATLQVFTYTIEDKNELALVQKQQPVQKPAKGHFWEPVLTGKYVNLHIFSAEDHYYKLSNSHEDLNLCFKQLGVQDVQLNTRLVPTGITEDDDPLPDGVKAEETETLAVRTQRMARLGRLVLEKGDANLAWYGTDALDGDGQACGSTGGKGG